jgi:ABC-2 type transport system ATP-binding protein/lipopolysaccharide transport system ATP-binding protein
MHAVPAIIIQAICKKYQLMKPASRSININFEALWALNDLSFEVRRGEILGIIGRNGAGKTTLLNIIAGALSPTRGEIKVYGRVLGLFNLGVGFQDELTGRENIFLNGALIGATRKELEHKLDAIIEFSELGNFIDMPLGTYSQGMRLRLAFSVIVNLDFDILAIDEVLAVGDTLFQSKCFERLSEFRREGKTMVITTQNTAWIQRFCDRVVVLNHGTLVFCGAVAEGVAKYQFLLSTEKFFVAPVENSPKLIENTKKWSEDMSDWGKQLGTKEVVIESVKFTDRFGFMRDKIKTGDFLKIKVHFNARNVIKAAHFGIAIFRQDGVYCFGPNTVFDGYDRYNIGPGKGWFALAFYRVVLAPGEYRISVAIWDKNEAIAFNYQSGYYRLTIEGPHIRKKELLSMPYRFKPGSFLDKIDLPWAIGVLDHNILNEQWSRHIDSDQVVLESLKIFGAHNKETGIIFTALPAKITINFSRLPVPRAGLYIWIGIYREDGIYCQGMYKKLKKDKRFSIEFRRLLLLPGSYNISVGVWDDAQHSFIMHHHGVYPLRVVSDRGHHGTVYLEHKWSWSLPKYR